MTVTIVPVSGPSSGSPTGSSTVSSSSVPSSGSSTTGSSEYTVNNEASVPSPSTDSSHGSPTISGSPTSGSSHGSPTTGTGSGHSSSYAKNAVSVSISSADIVSCTLYPSTSTEYSVKGHCQVVAQCQGNCMPSLSDFITNMTEYGGTTMVGFYRFVRTTDV